MPNIDCVISHCFDVWLSWYHTTSVSYYQYQRFLHQPPACARLLCSRCNGASPVVLLAAVLGWNDMSCSVYGEEQTCGCLVMVCFPKQAHIVSFIHSFTDKPRSLLYVCWRMNSNIKDVSSALHPHQHKLRACLLMSLTCIQSVLRAHGYPSFPHMNVTRCGFC